jgi:hypothetical protein
MPDYDRNLNIRLPKFLSRHEGGRRWSDSYEFNIKIYRVNIPDKVRDKVTEDEIHELYEFESEAALNELMEILKHRFSWIESVSLEGRSGGWLALHATDSVVEQDDKGHLVATPEALERLEDLEQIDGIVDEAKRNFVGTMESFDWWAEAFPTLKWILPGKKEWRPGPEPESR